MADADRPKPRSSWRTAAKRTFNDTVEAQPMMNASTLAGLMAACDLIDAADTMQRTVNAEGVIATGSQGQPVAHPLIAEVRHYRREAVHRRQRHAHHRRPQVRPRALRRRGARASRSRSGRARTLLGAVITTFDISIPDPSLPTLSIRLSEPLTDGARASLAAQYAAAQPRALRARARAAALTALSSVDVTEDGYPVIRHPGHTPESVPFPAAGLRA